MSFEMNQEDLAYVFQQNLDHLFKMSQVARVAEVLWIDLL